MILMLNCSYKNKNSNTQYFLDVLTKEIAGQTSEVCKHIRLKNALNQNIKELVFDMKQAKALVIGAPLYVDGLPAQAVKLLEFLLEEYPEDFQGLPVYVVSNLGFYEASQIKPLLNIVENWCHRMGMVYGGGLAIGAGPLVSTLKKLPLKSGLNKEIGKGVEALAEAILSGKNIKNRYCKTAIPRLVYLQAAHSMFRKTLKKNGAGDGK